MKIKIKKQHESNECGLFVIQAIYNFFYDKWLSIDYLKAQAKISKQGLNVDALIALGAKVNLTLNAFKAPIEALIKESEAFIGLVNNQGVNHYVIFYCLRNKFFLFDSASGKKLTYDLEQFRQIYQGIVITFERNLNGKLVKNEAFNLWTYLFENSTLIICIVIIICLTIALGFIATLFSKIIFDYVLPNYLRKTLNVVIVSFAFLAFLRAISNFFKAYFNKKLVNIIELDLTFRYLKRYRDCYMFETKKIEFSDHLRRLNLIPSVSLFIATFLQIIFQETLILIIAISLLWWLSVNLLFIAFAAALLLTLTTFLFLPILKNYYYTLVKLDKQEKQLKNEFLLSKNNLHLHEVGNNFFNRWQKGFISFKKLEQKIWFLSALQKFLILLINYLLPILLTWCALKLIFDQDLTLGAMMMFLSLLHFFIDPLVNICDFAFRYKQNSKNLQLVKFIFNLGLNLRNDQGYFGEKINSLAFEKFKVKFDKQIINIKKLQITNSIKIVGKNGIGKSIFAKTLNGSYQFEGNFLINDVPYQDWNTQQLQKKILLISNEYFLPSQSIYQYLTLNQENYEQKLIVSNRKYNLSNFLLKNKLSLQSIMINNGENFSTGQRQIIVLLKIFIYDYDLLILDEAFENLAESNWVWFKNNIPTENKIILEISHSKRFLNNDQELNFERINRNFPQD